jgi:glycosyltransferase involved in cell wall biosynthesis
MKRVLIITPNDLQNSSPQTLHMAEALRKEGAEVTLLGPIDRGVRLPDINFFRIQPGRWHNALTILAALTKASLQKYDLLIGFDEVGRIPCLVAALIRPGLKVILYNLEYFEDQRGSRCQSLARILFRRLSGKAALIADANEDRASLRAKLSGSERVAVIHNAAPLRSPTERPPEDPIYRGLEEDKVRLVYTGCKNHTVTEVIRSLKHVKCPVHLFVVGEIDPDYTAAIRESDSGNQVTLTGLLPRPRIPGILAWADIGISLYGNGPDAFVAQRMCAPNKVYEYMAWGLPSVCSDNPPLVRLVQETGWGICVPPADNLKIAAAIEKLAADKPLRTVMSEKALALHASSMNYEKQLRPVLALL